MRDNALYCGFAKKDISPKEPAHLAGYAARWGKDPAKKVHDPLFVKAMYVKDRFSLLLISADLCEISNANIIEKEIKSKTGIDAVILASTHTHSGPYTESTLSNPNAFDEKWYNYFVSQATLACQEAIKNSFEAKIKIAQGTVEGVGKNRRANCSAVDNELSLIYVKDCNDIVRGMLINFACHCTVLDANNNKISADYPAYIYSALRQKYDGVVVLFTNGAAGDINIGYSSDDSALGISMSFRSYEKAEEIANRISRKVMDIIYKEECTQINDIDIIEKDILLPLKNGLPSLQNIVVKIDERSEALYQNNSPEEKRKIELDIIYLKCIMDNIANVGNDTHCKIKVSLIKMGEFVFITFPLEMFCEIGIEIKEYAKSLGLNAVIIGYAGGYSGYLPTEEAYKQGGYEVEVSPFSEKAPEVLLYETKKALYEIANGL